MKKKLVAICISCAVVFTGPGMSMVTRAYADEITQDQQQDGNSANAQVSPGEDENNQADNTENSDDKLNDQNGQNQEDYSAVFEHAPCDSGILNICQMKYILDQWM